MRHSRYLDAHYAATDAARRHSATWRVFCDTNGRWNSERYRGPVPPDQETLDRAEVFGCNFGELYGPGIVPGTGLPGIVILYGGRV